MNIGYAEWRDGTGYDLAALDGLTPEELHVAELMLGAHSPCDWRDIEALDYIGSPNALAAVKEALHVEPLDVRMEAAERLAKRGLLNAGEIESIILDALERTTILNGMVKTLRLAETYPTSAIKSKLLSCALEGNDDIRVHSAALVHFLHGGSSCAFDANYRPFYLRFGSRTGLHARLRTSKEVMLRCKGENLIDRFWRWIDRLDPDDIAVSRLDVASSKTVAFFVSDSVSVHDHDHVILIFLL